MAADSLAVEPTSLYREVRKDSKIFKTGKNNEYLIGFAGSFRGGQILRFQIAWPEFPDIKSDDEFLRFIVIEIIPRMQVSFENHWADRVADDILDIIFAVKDRFAVIPSDLQVAIVHEFASIGSGSPIAIGALEVLSKGPLRLSIGGPESILRQALQAAEKHTAGVSSPFIVLDTAPTT